MRVSTRDEEFQTFFVRESDSLRRLAVFMTGDAERGADVAQEALVRVYRHWRRIRNDDPGPYARRVVVNLVRSAHRRAILERRHHETERSRTVAESGAGDVDEFLRVAEALKALTPIRRAAVVLRFYEDMTEADISRVLDRPVGTVKSDIHRGITRLRTVLSEAVEEQV